MSASKGWVVATEDKVWAVSMMRDEVDVAGAVVRHMAEEGVDGIIVADNRSVDGTRAELEAAKADVEARLGILVLVVDDPEVGYYQADKMTALAADAASHGATWIVPFDADELWWHPRDRVAVVLRDFPLEVRVVDAEIVNYFATAIDPPVDSGCPFEVLQWHQRKPGMLPKVAFRWAPNARIGQGNHDVLFVDESAPGHVFGLRIAHFPYRSAEHFERKARNGAEAYAATDLPEHQGAHWRSYGQLLEAYGPEALHRVYREHFWFHSPVDSGLVHEPAPYRRWPQ